MNLLWLVDKTTVLIFSYVCFYLKSLYIMHYKSSFNALIMPCNVPYNTLYKLMNNCNHS